MLYDLSLLTLESFHCRLFHVAQAIIVGNMCQCWIHFIFLVTCIIRVVQCSGPKQGMNLVK